MSDNNAVAATPRPITMDDVQRMIGSMMLEIEMLRRENAELKKLLETRVG